MKSATTKVSDGLTGKEIAALVEARMARFGRENAIIVISELESGARKAKAKAIRTLIELECNDYLSLANKRRLVRTVRSLEDTASRMEERAAALRASSSTNMRVTINAQKPDSQQTRKEAD